MHQYTISVNNKTIPIYRFLYEPIDSNMFFIPIGKTGVVFDPNISDDLLNLFDEYETKSVQIILTHEHYDHTTGVEWLQKHIKAPLFCHKDCAHSISSDKGNSPKLVAFVLSSKDNLDNGHRYEDFMSSYVPYKLKADTIFDEREKLIISYCSFDCVSTPGHSPGSACYILDEKYIFTGDSLIQNTPVILRFKESNKTIYEKYTRPFLNSLDKNMLVFPGHGDPFLLKETKNI